MIREFYPINVLVFSVNRVQSHHHILSSLQSHPLSLIFFQGYPIVLVQEENEHHYGDIEVVEIGIGFHCALNDIRRIASRDLGSFRGYVGNNLNSLFDCLPGCQGKSAQILAICFQAKIVFVKFYFEILKKIIHYTKIFKKNNYKKGFL